MATKAAKDAAAQQISRRQLLKWLSVVGGGCALAGSGVSLPFGFAHAKKAYGEGETVFHTACTVNCGSSCFLRPVVADGRLCRIETDHSPDTPHSLGNRACLRGRSMRQLVYSPDRIKYPMRRVKGTKRGEGKYERISWDEALDEIAGQWLRILKEYGPESVYRKYGSGTTSSGITNRNEWVRLANMLGGSLNEYGTYSTAQISMAAPCILGKSGSNNLQDMTNSRLVVFFGSNILETRQSGGGLSWELREAMKNGNPRVIVIDPRYSDTAALLADAWVPIRPGSDAALCAAIAHTLIKENLLDQNFLDTYCLGFDGDHMPVGVGPEESYKAYIMGTGPDGTEKTPVWAARITGYPADKIVHLARQIGQTKPVCIAQGWGPQRHANGDTIVRAICTLAAMTGNIGIAGGGTGTQETINQIPFPKLPTLTNPVKTAISFYTWEDAITRPEAVTATGLGLRGADKLKHGIKFMWNSSGNSLINQHSEINHAKKTLEDDKACEFIVAVETRMTPSALFGDIILPSVTPVEQDDLVREGYQVDQSSIAICRKAIEPLFEAKTQYDICNELAGKIGQKLGQPDFQQKYNEGRTQLDWVKHLYGECRKMKPELPADFEEASRAGWFKWYPPEHFVALKDFRADPQANPLKTPSGKIEIFSNKINELRKTWQFAPGETVHPLPVFENTWDGPADADSMAKFPFQLIGHHYKGRVHSSFARLPWLESVAPQMLWMNDRDAAKRGISHGDIVEIYNDRGRVRIPVKVTPRIMPGVLSLPQGAWYAPDAKGTDIGGCINTVTRYWPTPLAKGNPQHTNRVEIVRVAGGPEQI